MRYIVSYDISDDRLRSRIVKICEAYGQRVQKSVFECELNKAQIDAMTQKLEKTRKGKGYSSDDSIRIYSLCAACVEQIRVLGYRAPVYTESKTIVIG